MHTIRIDVSDVIYDKVMFFLQNLPQVDIKLHDKKIPDHRNSLVDFFANSPLKDVPLERDTETYHGRVSL